MNKEDALTMINSLHNDLKVAKELVYDKYGFDLTNPTLNSESQEYGACSFLLNGMSIQHRASKITPTKTGQFVTIWKRNTAGITTPFEISDDLDFIIITVRSGIDFGQFIFPKSILTEKGIISTCNKEGKRGIRVYPPWDITTNKQARKTQCWQVEYFLTINTSGPADVDLLKKLIKLTPKKIESL